MIPDNKPRAVIFGIEGTEITSDEWQFFKSVNPFGFILFSRNCISKSQISNLTSELKKCVKRTNVPIFIDQEGGRVIRLPKTEWPVPPSHGEIGLIGRSLSNVKQKRLAWLYGHIIGSDLLELGINVNCAPVLDLCSSEQRLFINDRSFGTDPNFVALMGKNYIRGLNDSGVSGVIKHIPGHGRASKDSHIELPIVKTSIPDLLITDFIPFRELSNVPYAMTAHVLFDAIDANFPVTFSQKTIQQIIRKHIGFNGLLLTDDLSMGALADFTLSERVELALKAGCDLILHCNANMSEMSRIASIIPELSKSLIEKSNINFNKIENNHYDNNALKEEFNILCKNTFVK